MIPAIPMGALALGSWVSFAFASPIPRWSSGA